MRLKRHAKRGFIRNIGYLKIGQRTQAKFYLGHDEAEAVVRNAALELVWQFQSDEGEWDQTTLRIAKAIASGSGSVVIVPPAHSQSGEFLAHWLERYRSRFGRFLKIQTMNEAAERAAYSEVSQFRQRATRRALDQVAIGYPVYEAVVAAPALATILDRARQDTKRRAAAHDPTGWLGSQVRQLETLIRLFGDRTITSRSDLQLIADALANPALMTQSGRKPLASETRRRLWERLIGTLRTAEDDRHCTLPSGADRIRLKLPRVAEAVNMKLFSIDHLKTLYSVALPMVRSFILLGLNCAYQSVDFGDLTDEHVFLDQDPPVEDCERGNWIVMGRKKTGVPGVHCLWEETADALRWLVRRRDEIVRDTGKPTRSLFISERGKNLMDQTCGGNKSYRIANLWRYCLRNAIKIDPTIPELGIKFLRKVSQQHLRRMAGDDIVSIHARRGQVSQDTLMKFYAARPFRKVADATDRLRDVFASVFAGQSFPRIITLDETTKRGRPALRAG